MSKFSTYCKNNTELKQKVRVGSCPTSANNKMDERIRLIEDVMTRAD